MRFVFSILTTCLFLSVSATAGQVETDYFAVLISGSKIGYSMHTRSVDNGLVTTSDDLKLTFKREDDVLNVGVLLTSFETIDGRPRGFKHTQDLSTMKKTVEGKITADGKLRLITKQIDETIKRTMDYPAGALMAEGLRLLGLEKGLKPGTIYETTYFSTELLAPLKTEITVGQTENIDLFGRVLPLTKVQTVMTSPLFSLSVVSYVDEKFKERKVIMPMLGEELEFVSCNRQFALSDNDLVDFLDGMLLRSPVEMKNIDSASSATYYLKPIAGAKLNIPVSAAQTVKQKRDSVIAVTVEPVAPAASVSFPYKGKDRRALVALKPTEYLQTGDEKVLALAAAAVGDAEDAAIAAKRIEAFVKGYISEKDLSVGYASAAEVALSRQGDCTEHAVLTAAMCRAVGIPARIVVGIVYADEFTGRTNIFGGHAWNEVYIGGRWVDLDSTRAPKGFGPGHIRLASGSGRPADFFNMASTLGYFTITKVTLRQ